MTENLGSTNIADLVNEEDTDINDDMVDKILNELENTDKDDIGEPDIDFNEMNNQNMDFSNMDFNNENNIDFRNENNIELNESDNTVKKINSILVNSTENHILSFNSFITHFKFPLVIFLLVIFLNNSFVTKLLFELLSKLTKQELIIDIISLFLRALVSSLVIFTITYLQIIN